MLFNLFKTDSTKTIHVNELEELIGKVDIIDIREPYEVKIKALKTAKNIPMGKLINAPSKYLLKDKTYYIMCQSGGRSSNTCKMLRKEGYHVINVAGGIGAYSGNQVT
ncbi:MAG: rhodanese-like domain-containing protein [Candidatus Galacturonibacter soehngenii]|nr:rhodanese-like domain-containing protein [Candidatus Galacturonibacter soehngenii]